jgi:hypothetical protein
MRYLCRITGFGISEWSKKVTIKVNFLDTAPSRHEHPVHYFWLEDLARSGVDLLVGVLFRWDTHAKPFAPRFSQVSAPEVTMWPDTQPTSRKRGCDGFQYHRGL